MKYNCAPNGALRAVVRVHSLLEDAMSEPIAPFPNHAVVRKYHDVC